MLSIERAGVGDAGIIQQLAYDIWPSAYGTILSERQITYMLNLMYNTDVLQQQMKEGQEFYIAKDEQKPIGFAAFALYKPLVYKLHKIYVLPQAQGTGVGKTLLQFIIDKVKMYGAEELILNVNRNNKAFHFYSKMGFTIVEEVNINIGEGYWMNDFIMQLSL